MSDASTVKVAIVGASGYSGEELVHRLLHHPQAELTAVTSRNTSAKLSRRFSPALPGQGVADTLQFTEPDSVALAAAAEIVFLALPHGVAARYAQDLLNAGTKVIDLSADFRLNDPAVYEEFYGKPHPAPELLSEAVYGMPELHRDNIRPQDSSPRPAVIPPAFSCPPRRC